MMGVKLVSASGGSVELVAPATATNYTQTLPANNGTVVTTASTFAGTGPAFSAYQATAQGSFTSGTQVKVTFDGELWDTNNNFASSRFTPTVAGYYQLNASVRVDNSPNRIIVMIWKNGGLFQTGTDMPVNTSEGVVSTLVSANGSTDYFEVYVYATTPSGSPTLSSAGTTNIWFNGFLARAA